MKINAFPKNLFLVYTITKVVNKIWNSKVYVKTIQGHMDSRKGAVVYSEKSPGSGGTRL